jgi:hypothetical protein
MFSQLKVGEVSIEEGEGIFEFPNDIPGDTLGMVTILAKIVDHDDFANLAKSQDVAWGVVTNITQHIIHDRCGHKLPQFG